MAAVTRALGRSPVPLAEIEIEGAPGLIRREDLRPLASIEPGRSVRLLPGFDPFTNELPRRVEAVLGAADHDQVHRTAGWVTPIVIVDGAVAGVWEIANGKSGAGRIVVRPFGRWRAGVRKELEPEVARIAAFLDRPLRLELARRSG